jgi:hypothetical protein
MSLKFKQTFGLLSLLLSLSLITHIFNAASASRAYDFSFSQKLKQENLCAQDSACSNSGLNIADMIKGIKQKIYAKINQKLSQHNLCIDSKCLNEGYNQLSIDKLKGKFSQKLEQTNECENSECINEGMNEITGNGNGNGNAKQTITQTNTCASGATCINSAGNVYLIGQTP